MVFSTKPPNSFPLFAGGSLQQPRHEVPQNGSLCRAACPLGRGGGTREAAAAARIFGTKRVLDIWPWVKTIVPPVNIPIPNKRRLKWVVHLSQNGTIGFDPWPYMGVSLLGEPRFGWF